MVLGIIALLLVVLAVRPLLLSIRQSSEELVFQKGQLLDLEKKSEDLKRFQAAYGSREANLLKMDRLFVNREEPIEFIKFLEKEAKTFGLAIEIAPVTLKAPSDDLWPSTNFHLTLDGSFPRFLQFLDRVESSFYLIDFSDFSLNKPGQSANGDIDISLQMKIYSK